jgi:UDP-N-acetylmuramoyl-tripeptide--D-alanyl-D-alanine ligase
MRNICIDSRELKPGDVFIPLKGETHDGHDFIKDALQKGATVLDVDLTSYAKAYRKKLKCAVIGITGSAGKTTTKDLLAAVLGQKFKVVKTMENQNNEIGVPITILRADYSTDILIVEMAMRNKGEIGHLASIVRPTHSIITSIGMTHIENFPSQKAIANAKAEIFKTPASWEKAPRYAFLNYSTPCSQK